MFIKPSLGSGAAGVIALRRHPDGIKQVLYSAIAISGQQLFNSKKIQQYRQKEDIQLIIDGVLQQENLVEQWLPKASVKHKTYDLRIVCWMAKLSGEWSEPPRSPLLTYICKTGLTASKVWSYLPQK